MRENEHGSVSQRESACPDQDASRTPTAGTQDLGQSGFPREQKHHNQTGPLPILSAEDTKRTPPAKNTDAGLAQPCTDKTPSDPTPVTDDLDPYASRISAISEESAVPETLSPDDVYASRLLTEEENASWSGGRAKLGSAGLGAAPCSAG